MKKVLLAVLFLLGWLSAAGAQVNQCVSSAVAGGTPDALTIPLLPCVFTTNLLVLTPSATNVTNTPTLQMTGFPAQPIVLGSGAIGAGALQAGAPVILVPTGSKWILVSQPGGGGGSGNGITALTGQVTATGPGSAATTLANSTVLFTQIQQLQPVSLFANPFNGIQNGTSVGLGSGLAFCNAGAAVCPSTPDNLSSTNYTIAALDMGGLRVMNGTSLTLSIPAISTNVLALGMGTLYNNTNSSQLTVSSALTQNGLPSPGALDQYGWVQCTSNSISLDCFGFPGFGTITTNAVGKFLDATGAETASSLVDNGTFVRTILSLDVAENGYITEFSNDTVTGTTANTLTKLTTSGKAIIAATTDTDGIVGVTVRQAGLSGLVQVAIGGWALCVFDNATTAGNFVGISSTTGGDCHDQGATRQTATQTIGRSLATNGIAGTNLILLQPQFTNTAGGGSGTVNSGTSGQFAGYSTTGTAVSGQANFTFSSGTLIAGVTGSIGGALQMNGAASGSLTLSPPAAAGSGTQFTFPGANGSSANLLLNQGSNATAWKALSGDCTITAAGAITCPKSSGTLIGTAAFQNTGTAGGNLPFLNGVNVWSGGNSSAPVVQNISGAFTPNSSSGNFFVLTLTASVTSFNVPSPGASGQCYVFKLVQGGAGSNKIAWASGWKFPNGGVKPTLSTTVGAIDEVTACQDSASTMLAVSNVNFQ